MWQKWKFPSNLSLIVELCEIGGKAASCLRQSSLAPRVARGMVMVGRRKTLIKKANATQRQLRHTRPRDPFFSFLIIPTRPRSVHVLLLRLAQARTEVCAQVLYRMLRL